MVSIVFFFIHDASFALSSPLDRKGTEEEEEEAGPSAWPPTAQALRPCRLPWEPHPPGQPGSWRSGVPRPSNSLRVVDFLLTCHSAKAPVPPSRLTPCCRSSEYSHQLTGDPDAGLWPVFTGAGSSQPPRRSQIGARADL